MLSWNGGKAEERNFTTLDAAAAIAIMSGEVLASSTARTRLQPGHGLFPHATSYRHAATEQFHRDVNSCDPDPSPGPAARHKPLPCYLEGGPCSSLSP